MIIETIIEVAQKLFNLRSDLAKSKQDRKQQVADFLEAVALTLEEAGKSLRGGVYPHGRCQELLVHSQHMESAIGDLIGQTQASELGRQLREAWEIERLHAELSNATPAEKERKLSVLDEAAGLFRATARFVRVSP